MNLSQKSRKISVFTLVMINVIAIDSLRSIAINAQYGSSLIFYYIIAALFFFIPSALVAAELASTWSERGGIYVWVREAFGTRAGFLVVWLQWIYNICWYPTILSFLAATLAYVISPNLIDNKYYTLGVILLSYWLTTLINCYGITSSGLLSTISAILGTIFPMFFIITLGVLWWYHGHATHINFTTQHLITNFSHRDNLILFSSILYGLVGIEMSAYHAQDVKNPKSDYPKALLYSTFLILFTSIGAALAVSSVVPKNILRKSLIDAVFEAFIYFFNQFHIIWMKPIIAAFIIIGIIGGVGAWIIGPSKGMLVASDDIKLPKFFTKINKHQAPIGILIIQGVIFSLISTVYLLMPTVNSAFFFLSNLTAQLSLVGYIFMFLAALKLRKTHKDMERPYKVPGGKFAIWFITLSGSLVSLFAIILTFLPPQEILVGSLTRYMAMLIGGFILLIIPPLFLQKKTQ